VSICPVCLVLELFTAQSAFQKLKNFLAARRTAVAEALEAGATFSYPDISMLSLKTLPYANLIFQLIKLAMTHAGEGED